MQKTGTIAKVKYKDSFDGKFGTMHCFDMAIETEEGMLIGTINSKSQEYPMGTGDEITVEVKDSQYGAKFRKVNPEYAGNSSGGGRDFDRENHGKCFTKLIEAAVSSGTILAEIDGATLTLAADLATACMNSYDYRSTGKPVATEPESQEIPF